MTLRVVLGSWLALWVSGLVLHGCARPAGAPLSAEVTALPSTTTSSACSPDDDSLAIRERLRRGSLEAEQVRLRCVGASDALGRENVAQALDVLVTRLLFLGAPPESIEQSGDTVTASIPAEDGVDLELFTARGALAMHAVDEAGIRALRQQPLPHEVVALEARWDEFMNALMVPVGVSVGDLSAMSVPGRRWMLLPSESPTRPAVLVHPAAITADDVMPCVAREVNDSEFAWMRVRLTEAGTQRFAALTERVAGDRVALAVDEVAWMAPVVQEAIRGGELTISGPRLADHRTHLAVLQRVLPEGVRCTAVPLR